MHWLETKLNSVFRIVMCYGFSNLLPLYIVTEYPRSGGSWFAQMISEYLDIPFRRNQLPRFESCVMHGHYLHFPSMRNVFVVLRDGRDTMVSFYFYSFFENERSNAKLVQITRKELPFADYEDVRGNLPRFIEYKFVRNTYPRFTWSEFVKGWVNENAIFVKYEDLVRDTSAELGKAIEKLLEVDADPNR